MLGFKIKTTKRGFPTDDFVFGNNQTYDGVKGLIVSLIRSETVNCALFSCRHKLIRYYVLEVQKGM